MAEEDLLLALAEEITPVDPLREPCRPEPTRGPTEVVSRPRFAGPPSQPGCIPILGERGDTAFGDLISRGQVSAKSTSTSRPPGYAEAGQGSYVQRITGLKMKKPLVSSSQLQSRLQDTAVLKLSQIRSRFTSTGLVGSWTTLCVLGERSKAMQSSTGSTYSIWKLTDLDQTTLSIFLFSGAHDELWKQAPGTLIAIFTPKVKNDRELCLTAISGDQVWVLGTAAEFGYCRAQKKDGQPCRVPVNMARCPFCPYHVQSEYNRVKPLGRNEFQGSTLSTAFRAGQQKGLHWQPGRFEPRIAAKPRMHAASPAALSSLAGAAASRGSTAGSKYLVSIADPASVAAAAASRSAAGGALHKALPQGRSVGTLVSQVQRGTKRKGGAVPAGGRGSASPAGPDEVQLAASDDEGEGDGHGPHDPGRRASGDDGARGRALALLMSTRAGQRGFTAPPRPAVPEFLAAPLRAAKSGGPQPDSGTPAAGAVELAAVAAGPQKPSATNTRRQRASSLGKENRAEPSKLASAFGEAVLAQEGDGLAAPGSRYAELVDDEDAARLDGVLQVLERKDELAARMDATTKLQVQAFSCRHCKYVAEKRRPECGGHPHLVDRVTATKRWWGCEACHHRFATMGVKYPTTRCAKCNHPENGFKALSQWRPGKESRTDQQSSVADRSQLLTRGVEQKWVGG